MAFIDSTSEITTILVVSDIATAKKWYQGVLGADLHSEYGGTSVVVKFLGNWLLLVTEGRPTPDKPEVVMAPPDNSSRVSHAFTIRVKDCQQVYAQLKAKGAQFLTEPVTNGAETRAFFRDPDGHLFEISEYSG